MIFVERNFLTKAALVFLVSFGLSYCDHGDSHNYTVTNIPSGFSLLDSEGNPVTFFPANSVLSLSNGTSLVLSFTVNGDLDLAGLSTEISDTKAFAHFASCDDKAGITGDVTLFIPATASDVQVLICPGATSLDDIISGCADAMTLTTTTPTAGDYTWMNTDRTGTEPLLSAASRPQALT
jgi:hypothetical protein